MNVTKILIATGNPGKFQEYTKEFADLAINFVNLKDVGLAELEVDEPFETIQENALHKAKIYAQKANLPTISDDSGLFVHALNNAPGVKSKRYAPSPGEAVVKIINALKGKRGSQRRATFRSAACYYEPRSKNYSIFNGYVNGHIVEKTVGTSRPGMMYDSVFYYPPLKKVFSQMSVIDKNQVSHRGMVIRQLKRYFGRQFGPLQFIVPTAILVKNRRMLLLQRRDSRPAFNNKWEFPGGGVENGESIEDCLKRETKEETGFSVNVIKPLPGVFSATRSPNSGNYQVFITSYLCTPASGALKLSDAETAAAHWCTLKQALNHDLLPLNKTIIRGNIKLLQEYID